MKIEFRLNTKGIPELESNPNVVPGFYYKGVDMVISPWRGAGVDLELDGHRYGYFRVIRVQRVRSNETTDAIIELKPNFSFSPEDVDALGKVIFLTNESQWKFEPAVVG